MRLHITLDDDLVAELDRRVGLRRRSSFVAAAVRRALDDDARWQAIQDAVGTVADDGHEWDPDPARWVAAQRGADLGRTG